MPFLLSSKNYFIIVDQKSKQGLFYQLYSSTGFSRPFQIQSFASNCYTATLDEQDKLHVVAQNAKNQLIHYTFLDGNATSNLLLEDNKDIYKFSNLMIYELRNQLHMFYTAIRPNTQSYSLVHLRPQQNTSAIDHLISSFSPTLPLKSISHDHQVDIFFTTANDEGYSLNCITYPGTLDTAYSLVTSEFPITSFDACFVNGIYHITYTRDVYGNSQLIYMNSLTANPLPLHLSNQLGEPCILNYLGYVWVTYLDNDILYALLSMDNGHSFSSPVKSSLQGNLYNYTYYSTKANSLYANSLYASVFNRVRLAIVSSIDTEEIHPDLIPNTELDLLLDGLSLALSSSSKEVNTPPQSSNASPMPTSPYNKTFVLPETMPGSSSPNKLPSTLEPSASSGTKKSPPSALRSATKAFMHEQPIFDAPPINPE